MGFSHHPVVKSKLVATLSRFLNIRSHAHTIYYYNNIIYIKIYICTIKKIVREEKKISSFIVCAAAERIWKFFVSSRWSITIGWSRICVFVVWKEFFCCFIFVDPRAIEWVMPLQCGVENFLYFFQLYSASAAAANKKKEKKNIRSRKTINKKICLSLSSSAVCCCC